MIKAIQIASFVIWTAAVVWMSGVGNPSKELVKCIDSGRMAVVESKDPLVVKCERKL